LTTISRDEFASAVRLHQAGDLAAATRLYESILDRDSTHADAFHLLGLLRHQQGQPRLAAELIGRAVALRPDAAVFRATLGEAYRALGRFDQAAGCCQAALQLGLADPAVHNNLGLALQALGRHDQAADAFRAALRLRPDDATAHTNLGAALRAADAKDQALVHFRRAVAIDPALAPARTNLGQLLLDLGRAAEALPNCQQAVVLQPDLPEAHNNLGNAYRALGRYPEAQRCYEEAIRLNPALAHAHVNLGLALQQQGHWDEALPSFRRAAELNPGSLPVLALLAEAGVDREQFDEAIGCYQKMLAIDPSLAAAHNALGWLLQEEGLLEEAGEHLRAALRLRPDLAIAHVNLGGVHEKRGDFAAAETCFRAAVADADAGGPALARLAMLLRGKLPDSDSEAIEQRLAGSEASDPARVNLLFGLGYVRDAQGRYAEAAAWVREANKSAIAHRERRNLTYDPAEHERLVSALIAAFDPPCFARLAGAGRETNRPVFIFGLPRSGTTLIEQILASHSQFHGAGEVPFTRQAFKAIPELLGRASPPADCIAKLNSDVVRRLALWHEERLQELDSGKAARIIDKMPDNYLHLGLIAVLFPNAVLIHCGRDPRDVALSCWMTGFRSVRWANDVNQIASRLAQHDRLMDHWRAVLPAPIHAVDYEETVAGLEPVARRLLAACRMDWEPACLDFHKSTRPVRTASFAQIRQPLYRRSIGRWQNYEHIIPDLFAALPPAPKRSE
jgi:tetratricopeptide (TPR) repeat protein